MDDGRRTMDDNCHRLSSIVLAGMQVVWHGNCELMPFIELRLAEPDAQEDDMTQHSSKRQLTTAVIAMAFALGFGLVLSLALAPGGASATGGSYQAPQPNVVSIPAGGSATLQVRGFCLDFGKPFPTGDAQAKGLADDK